MPSVNVEKLFLIPVWLVGCSGYNDYNPADLAPLAAHKSGFFE